MRNRDFITVAITGFLGWASLAGADARLVNVVPLDGGCISGPSGPSVQFWDVQPGHTYQLTLQDVAECGNGGTAPTINVRVNSTGSGNTDLVATNIGPGAYVFSFTMPANGGCTFPIYYCTTPGQGQSGLLVRRNDGAKFQAHLRASTFGPGCGQPTPITNCTTGARPSTWGRMKLHYR